MGIVTIPLACGSLPGGVARHLLHQHHDELPDLSGLIVLVPNQRAGQDFAHVLVQCAALPALIPPRITPLKAWADTLADSPAEASSRRLTRLYATLRRESWLDSVDKWALAEALLALADELSTVRLAGDLDGRIRAFAPDREIALIEAVWRTFNQDGSDPQAAYARALDRLAEAASLPLYAYAPGPLTAVEKRFFERYAERAPVYFFEVLSDPGHAVGAVLDVAWRTTTPSLPERARALASTHPDSPLGDRIKLCPASHLEAEARAAVTWVAGQLQAGRRKIALIALDRESSRRARALLERLDVLIEDETGWTLSTTAVAAVVDRWLECVSRDFPHVELLDLLKSPFVLGDLSARQDAVLALEFAMRHHGVSQGMTELLRLAQNHVIEALPCLDTLAAARRQFGQSYAALSVWLERLNDSLVRLGAVDSLRQDAAGASLIDTLDALRHELQSDAEPYGFAEWRRWLNRALENASFIDTRVTSPVVLTSLPAARGRVFEAVAVIGADARHLPASPSPGLFSQSARAQLGLPTAIDQALQSVDDLIPLLSQGSALLSWQAWQGDEPNPESPLITRLRTLHQAAWGTGLEIQSSAEPPAVASPPLAPIRQPAPVVSPDRLPRRYSPTAYQTLIECPYRFFVRYVLGLAELTEADEALDKSDYGNALHRVLKCFHDANPPAERAAALSLLTEISAAEFSGFPAFTAAAWKSRWDKIQSAYLDFWLSRENEGWHYQSGETPLKARLDVPALGEIELQGVIDRIDRREKALQVIDYKTGRSSTLKNKLKDPGENVQLPVYAWLCDAAAAYLAVNDDKLAPLALDFDTDVEGITLRLRDLVAAIARGAALPAHGVDAVCRHCEARGLCRKGMWHE